MSYALCSLLGTPSLAVGADPHCWACFTTRKLQPFLFFLPLSPSFGHRPLSLTPGLERTHTPHPRAPPFVSIASFLQRPQVCLSHCIVSFSQTPIKLSSFPSGSVLDYFIYDAKDLQRGLGSPVIIGHMEEKVGEDSTLGRTPGWTLGRMQTGSKS